MTAKKIDPNKIKAHSATKVRAAPSTHLVPYELEKETASSLPVQRYLEFVAPLSLDLAAPDPHILIEGDNLLALEYLKLTHPEKIDFIYIDPPYNTGNTGYTYKDKFAQTGDAHGPWIHFMRQRLSLAKELMAEHGVITISIDDREYVQLKMLCDSVFGESNWISTLVWHSKYTVANDARFFSRQHEYVLVYAKNKSVATIGKLPRTAKSNAAYKNPDNDIRGPWKATPIHAKSGNESGIYEFTFPNGRVWSPPDGRYPRYSQARLSELYHDDRLWFGKDGKASVSAKTFLAEVSAITPGTILGFDQVGHTHSANEQLANLIGKGKFDNPKPVELISTLIRLGASSSEPVILDFFAGSGTTAEAVARLNHQDGGRRQAIICTNNENDICRDVTFQRLRAVHTGEHANDPDADPIPVPLRYFVLKNRKTANSLEAHAMLVTGHQIQHIIGPRKIALLLSDGTEETFVVHQINYEIVKMIKKRQKTVRAQVFCSSANSVKLEVLGIKNVKGF
jgi:adenine-specific DNA-methyltransferase